MATMWYCSVRGRQYGPVPEETLSSWVAQGRVGPNDVVWNQTMPTWAPMYTVASLMSFVPPPGSVPPPAPALKSKLAGGLLGILVGGFGIHNFYLGYNGKAVAQLLLSVLSCGILYPISHIWGLVEGILILTGSINIDADGRPLGE